MIAQAGVCDLRGAYRRWHGGAVLKLMGGSPEDCPERYAVGDPMSLLSSGGSQRALMGPEPRGEVEPRARGEHLAVVEAVLVVVAFGMPPLDIGRLENSSPRAKKIALYQKCHE